MLSNQSDPRFVSHLTRDTYAIILAGGRGSRLADLTDWRAKPAVPFGGKFRMIDFTLSNCVNSGVRRIGVATQYKAHSLIRHLQRGWSFLDGRIRESIDILPAQQQIEEFWYRGTADAVFQNIDILRTDGCKYVLVLSGDHVYKMDYGRMLAYHASRRADLTVACVEVPVAEAQAFGIIQVDDEHRVVGFLEKPPDAPSMPGHEGFCLASMGVYVFNAEFLFEQLSRDADEPNTSHDFGKNIIPHAMARYNVAAHHFADSCVGAVGTAPYWRDVGTLDAFWEANLELTKITPELNLYDAEWPIWTFQEQLPPAKFVFDEDDRRGGAYASMVSGGCIISGATVRRSVLFSNVRVESHANVEDSVVLPDVEIAPGAVLRRTVIDQHCRIPEGLVVGLHPEEDRRRFHVTAGGVTLVTPEMLGQRVHQMR
jgi:glucose-1-phosphate adenylyltransferase